MSTVVRWLGVALLCACAGSQARERERDSARARAVEREPAAELGAWAKALEAQGDPAARAAECARKLGATDQAWQDCHARPCQGASSLIVEAQAECGGDSCDGDAYLYTANGRKVALPFAGHKACAPDGSFVVADVVLEPTTEDAFYDPPQWQVVLLKFPSDGQPSTRFADCMSPALTPDGRAFVCRDKAGAVLQVPLAGGQTKLVAEAGVPPQQVAYNPQSAIYPAPARFEADALRFSVESDQGPIERSVPWPPAR